MENNNGKVKCVVVGDGGAGKTAMLTSFVENKFPQDYIPTVCENKTEKITVNGKEILLDLWDTAGQESYERIRSLSYPNTNIFLVCFSVVYHPSFENVKANWITEVRHFCPHTPYLLVGLKIDLRTDEKTLKKLKIANKEPISSEEGVKLARQIKASKYVECSALTQIGLRDVFREAICAAMKGGTRRRQRCTLL